MAKVEKQTEEIGLDDIEISERLRILYSVPTGVSVSIQKLGWNTDAMFGIFIISPVDIDSSPNIHYFIAQRKSNEILIGGEYTSEFYMMLDDLEGTNVISEDYKYLFGLSALGDGSALLSLPWKTSTNATYTQGPHVSSSTSTALSSLDFVPADYRVYSARDGFAQQIICSGKTRSSLVIVTSADGWRTNYYHVTNPQVSTSGRQVGRNEYLGDLALNSDDALQCGGGWTGPHVHFSLLKNGAHVSVVGVDIGGWTVGGSGINGTLTRISDGAVRYAKQGLNRTVYNNGSIGSGSSTPVPTPPPAPTGVNASDGLFADKVRITWNASTGATSYQVWRNTTSSFFTPTPIKFTNISSTSFDDTSAEPGVQYYYWVFAVNNAGSNVSNYDLGHRIISSPPATPTGVFASDDTFTDRIRISWYSVVNATYYQVYRIYGGGASLKQNNIIANMFDDFDVYSGDTFTYAVKACNISGCSALSIPDTGSVAPTILNTPSGVTASDGNYSDKIRISWNSVPKGNSLLLWYQIFRGTSPTRPPEDYWEEMMSQTYIDDTTAIPGVTYYYWVKACNGEGCSGYSNYNSGWRAGSTPSPIAPSSVDASDGEYTDKICIEWGPGTNASYYQIFRNYTMIANNIDNLDYWYTRYFCDRDAQIETEYQYQVKACNNTGCSGFSPSNSGWRSGPVIPPGNDLIENATPINSTPFVNNQAVSYASTSAADPAISCGVGQQRYKTVWYTYQPVADESLLFRTSGSNYDTIMTVWSGNRENLVLEQCNDDFNGSQSQISISLNGGQLYYIEIAAYSNIISGSLNFSADVINTPGFPLSVNASDGVFSDKTQIDWDRVGDADYYQVWRSANNLSTSSTMIVDNLASNTFIDTSGSLGTTYYYWVKACNFSPIPCSEFSDGDSGYFIKMPTPSKVVLSSPSNGQRINTATPELSWKAAAYGETYQVQISKSYTFKTLVEPLEPSPEGIYGLTYALGTELPDGKYYWRVRARNLQDKYGAWSDYRAFTVDTIAPSAPVQLKPVNGAERVGTPTFSWSAASGAVRYQFAYGTSTDPEVGNVYKSGELSVLTHKPPAMGLMTQYYWFVQARDAAGNWSDWSTPFAVSIIPPKPAKVVLISPANGSRTNDTTPEFKWKATANGEDYRIQISTNSTFSNLVDLGSSSYEIEGLAYTSNIELSDGKYYWRVSARNLNNVYGAWSDYRAFTVDTIAPSAPAQLKPVNGTERVGTPTFSWSAASGAVRYQFAYGTSTDPEVGNVYKSGELSVLTHKPPAMGLMTQYYWFVRARDAAGNWSNWSTPFAIMIKSY